MSVKGAIQFTEVTDDSGITFVHTNGASGKFHIVETVAAGLALFDYDNDNDIDIYFLNGAYHDSDPTGKPPRNTLYRNDGNWRFVDVTETAGVGDQGYGLGVAVADYDNDGDIGLFVAEVAHAWAGDSADRSCLLVNLGPQAGYRFERRYDLGIDRHHDGDRWNEGDLYAAWIDFDNDGLQDLLISSGDYPDGQFLRLFHQQADHRFVEVTAEAGFSWEGSGCLSLADFDHDGDVDILVTRSNTRLPPSRSSALPPRVALFRNNVGQRNHFLTVRLIGRGEGGANRSAIGTRVIVRTDDLVQTREVYGGLGHKFVCA